MTDREATIRRDGEFYPNSSVVYLVREIDRLRETNPSQMPSGIGDRELSAYAFNKYGTDAKLYNGIHDLETELIRSRANLQPKPQCTALYSPDMPCEKSADHDGLHLTDGMEWEAEKEARQECGYCMEGASLAPCILATGHNGHHYFWPLDVARQAYCEEIYRGDNYAFKGARCIKAFDHAGPHETVEGWVWPTIDLSLKPTTDRVAVMADARLRKILEDELKSLRCGVIWLKNRVRELTCGDIGDKGPCQLPKNHIGDHKAELGGER